MDSCKRVIARLDVKGKKLIKGIRFEGVRVIGDAYNFAKKYADNGVDEIFYSDAVASLYGRNSLTEVLRETTKNIFVPITVGGAIRTIEDGRKLLSAGADKLAINTAAVNEPNLINKLSEKFGKQCVVLSIQASRSSNNCGWDVMIESGRERTKKDLFKWIEEVQERGAGEILITSVDKDGTGSGPDLELIEKIISYVNVPLVFGGGIVNNNQVGNILNKHANLSGLAIGYGLHYEKIDLLETKKTIEKLNLPIRSLSNNKKISFVSENLHIGIINYGMGNIQSLKNAFELLGNRCSLVEKVNFSNNVNAYILPGVGAFPEGMKQLRNLDLIESLRTFSFKGGPLIGICLGMQLLFDKSMEYEETEGLGLISGIVERIPDKTSKNQKLVLPHVGWNKIIPTNNNNFQWEEKIDIIEQYFVHSYVAIYKKILNQNTICISNYGGNKFASVVRNKNTVGLQFHPERSGMEGLKLLSNITKSLVKTNNNES